MNSDISSYWGHLHLLRQFRHPIMAIDMQGKSYVRDSHGPLIWQLRCDCGHEWEIAKADFPGRRKLRSCGRFQCPFTPKPKPKKAPEDHTVAKSYTLPLSLIGKLQAHAKQHGLSSSRSLRKILSDYFVQQFIDDEGNN